MAWFRKAVLIILNSPSSSCFLDVWPPARAWITGVKKVVRTEAADRHPLMLYPRHAASLHLLRQLPKAAPCLSLDGLIPPNFKPKLRPLAARPWAPQPALQHGGRHFLPARQLCLSGWLGLHPNVLTAVDFDGYCMGCAQVPGCRRQCSAGLPEQQQQTGMARLLHMWVSRRLQA